MRAIKLEEFESSSKFLWDISVHCERTVNVDQDRFVAL